MSEDDIDEVGWINFMDKLFCEHRMSHYDKPTITDTASLCIISHLSFLLDLFLPTWAITTGAVNRSQVASTMDMIAIAKTIKSKDEVVAIPAGSAADGIYLPIYVSRKDTDRSQIDKTVQSINWYDLDLLLVLKKPEIPEQDLDFSHTYPGYCRWRRGCNDYWNHDAITLDMQSKKSEIVRSGPAWTEMELYKPFDVDFVPTMTCKTWAKQAEPWITRHRPSGWPTADIIREIVSAGTHLVAKAHPCSTLPDAEWRVSFVMAERKLIGNISSVQKQAYIICKLLIKYILTPDMAFSSYCLKTTFFWTLESLPSEAWEDKMTGLATGVLSILDRLIGFLAEHRVPMYFIPENNILEHVSERDLRMNNRRLVQLRQNLIRTILDFDDKYYIEDVSHIQPLRTALPSLEENNGTMKTQLGCYKLQLTQLLQYCAERTMVYNVDMWGAVYTCEYLIERINQVVSTCCCKTDKYSAVMVLRECALDLMMSAEDMTAHILASTAVIMSVIYLRNQYNIGNSNRYEAWIVVEMFEEALKLNNRSCLVHVYYAMFLMSRRRHKRAEEILEAALVCDEQHKKVVSAYFDVVPEESLDPLLYYVSRLRVVFDIPAKILAEYLLIRIYAKSNHDKLSDLFVTFNIDVTAIQKFDHNLVYESCNLLLAHIYQASNHTEYATAILEREGVTDGLLEKVDNPIESLTSVQFSLL